MESFRFDSRGLRKYDSLYFASMNELVNLVFWRGWSEWERGVTASVLDSMRLRNTLGTTCE